MPVLARLARCVPVRPATPPSRLGMAGWAIGTVAFFGAVGGLPRDWTNAAGMLLPALVAVGLAVPAAGRRTLERWLTAPYVLLGTVAIVLDAALFSHGSLPALLVGALPAGGGLLSWSRPRSDRPGAEGETP